MISDNVFRAELDASLKKQKILKKERNEFISLAMCGEISERDALLEKEDLKARKYQEKVKESKRIPLEDAEQIELVQWFRDNYSDKVIMLINNDDNRVQTKNILMGLHRGASDLFIPHLHLFVEMKRLKPKDSVWSEYQQKFKKYVEEVCGDTYILGYGFEDAKEKILKHIDSMIE